jgi:predicted DNA-binding transcriptional regulator YafY
MYSPVTRLLTVLDLLQSRPSITAAQLAERLEVNGRSARRYIGMLQDLGIPIEAERGRYGGYRLRPGYKLPPLMWTEEEALAVTLGLRAAQQLGLARTLPTVESALAKVERVLPTSLRERVQAVQEMVVLDVGEPTTSTQTEHVALLSMAAYRGLRTTMSYQAKAGEQTERLFDCYGLAYHGGRWYAIGYCHLRQSLRVFRLDRIQHVKLCEEQFTRPAHFDCLAYAVQSFLTMPSRWLVEAVLETTPDQLDRRAVPPGFASLEETEGGLLLRAYDDDLEHVARFLVHLGCPFRVVQPPELLDVLQHLAEGLLHSVEQARLNMGGATACP